MSYQFIVIYLTKERKDKMEELFNKLKIPSNLIYYLEASTPQNSTEYFAGNESMNETRKKIICCGKSHFRALEYSIRNESPEYSIVVEDDVAFHKTDFLKIIHEIILNSNKTFATCDYISLGWLPFSNYENYTKQKSLDFKIKNNLNEYVFFNNFYVYGTQCYIVKKDRIKKIESVLGKKTFNVFIESVKNFLLQKYGSNFDKVSKGMTYEDVDLLWNRLLDAQILFPQIAIEQKGTKSTLGHSNENLLWFPYFKGYAELMRNYMTY